MQKFCQACGMPLTKKEDFAGGDENSNFCHFCVNADGSVKSCEEIFEGGVQFFLNQTGGERKMAEKITRKNMSGLPYWQGKDCPILQGEMATDEEFAEVMKKLG
ncbi:MAG: zinc ribbon domain-containing protein [Patescibacteria group bacterium]